jgi:2-dehydro-3-deoxyphosphogluconate aldolase/(4S)-4-hydroxy-2-oxoglutarate aldolase
MSAATLDELFHDTRVMGILRGFDEPTTVQLCEQLWSSGVRSVEIPIQTATARAVFLAALVRAREHGLPLGVGTVLDIEQLEWAHLNGAAFAVAPGFDPAISRRAAQLGLPLIPGVATASEITAARAAGHRWLKAFPAAQLGADWIRSQLAPFPDVHFVATGGIDVDNAESFLAAGCRVVAIGSAIARDDVRERIAALVTRHPDPSEHHPKGPNR